MAVLNEKKHKCLGCGKEIIGRGISGHAQHCKDFQEFKKLIIEDPQTPSLIKEHGINGAAAALGMNPGSLNNWFDKAGNIISYKHGHKIQGKPIHSQESSLIVELTEEQIISVFRKMIQEHDELVICRDETALLQAELTSLKIKVQECQVVINKQNEERLKPLRVRIEREAIEQCRESH